MPPAVIPKIQSSVFLQASTRVGFDISINQNVKSYGPFRGDPWEEGILRLDELVDMLFRGRFCRKLRNRFQSEFVVW
jgi:hypothetical protein